MREVSSDEIFYVHGGNPYTFYVLGGLLGAIIGVGVAGYFSDDLWPIAAGMGFGAVSGAAIPYIAVECFGIIASQGYTQLA